MPWWRVLLGLLLVGYGLAMGVVTITVTADSSDPYAAMQTSGSSSILVGVGLAILAPVLLRWFAAAVRPFVGRTGAAGHLAAFNTSRRAHLLSGVLAPVIVFTAASAGTLMLVGIDGRTLAESNPDSDTINLLNNVVVGMISVFAAIMVVNAFAAVITHRRGELARLRLLGATPEQVRGSVLAEAGIVAAAGVVLGLRRVAGLDRVRSRSPATRASSPTASSGCRRCWRCSPSRSRWPRLRAPYAGSRRSRRWPWREPPE